MQCVPVDDCRETICGLRIEDCIPIADEAGVEGMVIPGSIIEVLCAAAAIMIAAGCGDGDAVDEAELTLA